ncbi:MAG: hypothetical protein ACI4JF_06585, partial [Oscillospiraceae bacterium]
MAEALNDMQKAEKLKKKKAAAEPKTARQIVTDILYWALRFFTIVNVLAMFFPAFNPARISEKINKNMSLFTCGASYESLITEMKRSFSRGWVP